LAYSQASEKDDMKRDTMYALVAEHERQNYALRNGNAQDKKQLDIDYENEKKTLNNGVLKGCLDKDLMLAKALKAGMKVLKAQNVDTLQITNVDSSSTNQVLAQAFAGFNTIRKGIEGAE